LLLRHPPLLKPERPSTTMAGKSAVTICQNRHFLLRGTATACSTRTVRSRTGAGQLCSDREYAFPTRIDVGPVRRLNAGLLGVFLSMFKRM
jgi:hypothetical protein